MEITEVRVKLVAAKNDKLRAFCSITIDDAFVIRDLKVIEGAKGPFVAMPSRKVTERCKKCGEKNHHRARYCNDCGARLALPNPPRTGDGTKLHADIAHPINSRCRELVQQRVLDSYTEEVERAQEPGYLEHPDDFEGPFVDEPTDGTAESVGAADRQASPGGATASDASAQTEFEDAPDAGVPVAEEAVGLGVGRRDEPDSFDLPGSRSRVSASEDAEFGPLGDFRRGGSSSRPPLGGRGRSRGPLHEPEPAARLGDKRAGPGERSNSDEPETEPEDNFGAGLFS